jgi:hypothetical protein
MTGGADSIRLAPMRPDLRPDLDWLEAVLLPGGSGSGSGGGGSGRQDEGRGAGSGAQEHANGDGAPQPPPQAPPPRVVVLVNPSNPSGILLTRAELDRAADLCGRAGAWLVIDNTYAEFCFEGREHYCPAGPHVVHIFSMSKAFGMMGWRIGAAALRARLPAPVAPPGRRPRPSARCGWAAAPNARQPAEPRNRPKQRMKPPPPSPRRLHSTAAGAGGRRRRRAAPRAAGVAVRGRGVGLGCRRPQARLRAAPPGRCGRRRRA